MKIILSRKGFDGTYGGFPSPILEDGKMISLPIPIDNEHERNITYDLLSPQDVNLGSLLRELGKTPKIDGMESKYVHFDPDLYEDSLPLDNEFGARLNGWRGLFGTDQNAARMLCNDEKGVDEGDIFLFFGLFNHVVSINGKRKYKPNSQGFHQIWGWMQIDRIIRLDQDVELTTVPKWAKYHPHCHHPEWNPNVLFIGRQNLCIDGLDTKGISGYGTIKQYNEKLTLTEMDPITNNKYYNKYQTETGKKESTNDDIKISLWKLPSWFYHEDITKRLGCHNESNPETIARWNMDNYNAYLKSTSPGQEFILDLDHYPPEAKQWVLDIITSGSNH